MVHFPLPLPFPDLDTNTGRVQATGAPSGAGGVAGSSLSAIVQCLKGLYFTDTKLSVLDALLGHDGAAGSAPSQPFGAPMGLSRGRGYQAPHITFNRLRASEAAAHGDPMGTRSIFGQLHVALRRVGFRAFRNAQPHTQLWNAALVGEGSIDVGGAFRETLTMACQELMDGTTPLFILTPNGANNVGFNREKRIIAPSATTPVQLNMFTCLGALIGACLRSKFTLPLDLSLSTWKLLLEEPLTVDDLDDVDRLCLQALNGLRELPSVEDMGQAFTTLLSDGREVELKPGGASEPVTNANVGEYCDLVVKARLEEGVTAARAMRAGLEQVVPLTYLSLFKPFEIEMLVCGDPELDVEVLRRHTVFRGGYHAAHPVVQNLFRALNSFTSDERKSFLRFVWGRCRLPARDADWEQPFTLQAVPMPADPGATPPLPQSHTCFFSLDLPMYPTYEQLREKLLYAATECLAIDLDFVPTSAW